MKKPTVWIANQFYNESELLDLKLNEIGLQLGKYDIPWKMIIAESNETFTKNPKPLYYADNKDSYPFKENIISEVMDGTKLFLPENTPMQNDFLQKCSVENTLKQYAEPDDIVVICDLDEIPDFRKILAHFQYDLNNIDKIYTLMLSLFYYSYNNFATFRDDRVTIFPYRLFEGVTKHRGMTNRNWLYLEPSGRIASGWHFSYLGDLNFIKNKIQNFGHNECNTESVINNLEYNIKTNNDPYGRGFKYPIIPIDTTSPQIKEFYPEYFITHIDLYKHNIRGNIK